MLRYRKGKYTPLEKEDLSFIDRHNQVNIIHWKENQVRHYIPAQFTSSNVNNMRSNNNSIPNNFLAKSNNINVPTSWYNSNQAQDKL